MEDVQDVGVNVDKATTLAIIRTGHKKALIKEWRPKQGMLNCQ